MANEAGTLAFELCSPGSNLDPCINCHLSVSQAGRFINVRAVPLMDINLGILCAGTSLWTLKIPQCPSQ